MGIITGRFSPGRTKILWLPFWRSTEKPIASNTGSRSLGVQEGKRDPIAYAELMVTLMRFHTIGALPGKGGTSLAKSVKYRSMASAVSWGNISLYSLNDSRYSS